MEIRDNDTVFVMTQEKGQDIANKLIDRKALKDSVHTLILQVHYKDSINSSLTHEISFLQEDLDLANQTLHLKDERIANHVKIEKSLKKEIKISERKKFWSTLVGTLCGVGGGVLLGILLN